jgi:catechol 2,3-dioxygenase-like lactoylglutathione lyase family enzyme
MLNQHTALATVAVRDIKAAQRFYEDVLGLRLVHSQQGMALTFESSGTRILVYQSEYAGTNRATAVTWEAGNDVDAIVAQLRSKGVAFEHYDDMPMPRKGDVYEAEGFKIAWFKDPDGNIHALTGS